MYFFDYGNAFLLEASRAGADLMKHDGQFVTLLMYRISWARCISITDLVLNRWVCTSSLPEDLAETDRIAAGCLRLVERGPCRNTRSAKRNIHWIKGSREEQTGCGFAGPDSLCRCTRPDRIRSENE
jgi:urocanate hydratase